MCVSIQNSNHILYLNNRLHKFGFVESPLCSLCNREPESILHLFCNCKETQQWCKNHISLPHLTPKLVLLGELDSSNSEFVLKNHLILLFKRFVYRSRVNTIGFNFLAFKYHIRYVLNIEQKIAREKWKLSVHFDKWKPISDLVSDVNWSFMQKRFVLIWVGDRLLGWVVREPTRILWWPALIWGWQWVWSLFCCGLGLGVVWSTLIG